VLASSNHVTGGYPVGERVGVEDPVRPDSFYGASKVALEAAGRMYAEKFGLEVAALRIGTFADRPTTTRHLSTWASHPDTVRAVRAAMTTPALGFAVFYVVSANRDGWWDLGAGEAVGFTPQDRAEDARGPFALDHSTFQGGEFAEPDFTVVRQRP
jgi:uronate dehydrogenase